jgi:hypothetical protein
MEQNLKEPDPTASLEALLKTSPFYDSVTQVALENVLKSLKKQEEKIKELDDYVQYLKDKAT